MGDFYGEHMVEDLSHVGGNVLNLWEKDAAQEEVNDDVSDEEVEVMEVGEDELVIAASVPNYEELEDLLGDPSDNEVEEEEEDEPYNT